jgi:hypothetical protein
LDQLNRSEEAVGPASASRDDEWRWQLQALHAWLDAQISFVRTQPAAMASASRGSEIQIRSCGASAVFVDEATEQILSAKVARNRHDRSL